MSEKRQLVLLDACVLYPFLLRDTLMHLALVGLFDPKWTEQIHKEWISNLLRKNPRLNSEKVWSIPKLMDKAFPKANVELVINALEKQSATMKIKTSVQNILENLARSGLVQSSSLLLKNI